MAPPSTDGVVGTGVETRFVGGGPASAARWQVLEEYTGTDGAGPFSFSASYVYGNYIDETLNMVRDLDPYTPGLQGGPTGGVAASLYFHHDDLFSATALSAGPAGVSAGGTFYGPGDVIERYEYGDFGLPRVQTAAGAGAAPWSLVGNTRLFTGREWDPEVQMYHYRTRYMLPDWGRFTTRDSIGAWGDTPNFGNGQSYVGNNALSFVDPLGRQRFPIGVPVRDEDIWRWTPPAPQFDPLTDPVEPRDPKFEGPRWYRSVPGFSDPAKEALREGARQACTRAQRALQALYNGATAACVQESLKKHNVGRAYLEQALRTFLLHYCRGSSSPRQFIFRPTERHVPPQIVEPGFRGFPRTDKDFPFWFPVTKTGDLAPQDRLPVTITHEACHQLSNTPDSPDENYNKYPNTQQGIDHSIDSLLQCLQSTKR